jgi:hypothetical protein
LTYLESGQTIDNNSYLNDSLKSFIKKINEKRPASSTNNVKIYLDEDRPHMHSSIKKYIKTQNFILFDHLPYSPDLSLLDLWLFDYIKQHLTTQPDVKSISSSITEIVCSIPKQECFKISEK